MVKEAKMRPIPKQVTVSVNGFKGLDPGVSLLAWVEPAAERTAAERPAWLWKQSAVRRLRTAERPSNCTGRVIPLQKHMHDERSIYSRLLTNSQLTWGLERRRKYEMECLTLLLRGPCHHDRLREPLRRRENREEAERARLTPCKRTLPRK